MTINRPTAVPALVSRAHEIMEDPDLCEHDLRRLATVCMAALVATCPTTSLPDEYVRLRPMLRPGSGATPEELREAGQVLLNRLAGGGWNTDRAWIVEATLDPVRGRFARA